MPARARSPLDPVTTAARVVATPWRVKTRVDEVVRPALRTLGVVGLGMLVGCAVLAGTPDEQWPESLDPGRLPVYGMVSLVTASLLGWAFVHDGQVRIRRRIGRRTALAAYVVLPITFSICGMIGASRLSVVGGPAPGHWFWSLVHWYGPVLAVLNLVAFLTWKSRGRAGRGLWFALLVAPYAFLLAVLVFRAPLGLAHEAHRATLLSMGSWAVALQFALGYFVGGAD